MEMPKKDFSHVPKSLRQTYKRDPEAVAAAGARLAAILKSGEDTDTSWADDLPDADEGFPVSGDDVQVTFFRKG